MFFLYCKEQCKRTDRVHTLTQCSLHVSKAENELNRNFTIIYTTIGGYYANAVISNRHYVLPPISPSHIQHNFTAMRYGYHRNTIRTTLTRFAQTLVFASAAIPDNPPVIITPTVFQAVVYIAVGMATSAATKGLDIIPSDTVGR